LNSIEKRAAVETGQETDRQDINVRGDLQAQADVLRKAFTLDELEAMDAKVEAARKGTKLIEAPAAKPSAQGKDSSDDRPSEGPLGSSTHVNGYNPVGGSVPGHVNGNGHKESWR
jgi:hypothetical protein